MMMIDADALVKIKFHGYPEIEIVPSGVNAEAYKRGWNDAIDAIIECEPSIDAVSIVRCKNCKYWHREIYNGIEYFNFSSCDLNHHGDGHNFYCADAERKES